MTAVCSISDGIQLIVFEYEITSMADGRLFESFLFLLINKLFPRSGILHHVYILLNIHDKSHLFKKIT